jgi:large subunit ribosomal protein L21
LTDVAPDAKTIELSKVLFIGEEGKNRVGKPYIEGAKVIASFDGTAEQAVVKGKKVVGTSYRKRKSSQRRVGHRQKYLQITIDKIQG